LVVLVKGTLLFVTAVNFSVVEALCALATAGSTSAPVVPRTTAAPAAAMDMRILMITLLFCLRLSAQGTVVDVCDAGRSGLALARRQASGRTIGA
jgi:hypothetical protein